MPNHNYKKVVDVLRYQSSKLCIPTRPGSNRLWSWFCLPLLCLKSYSCKKKYVNPHNLKFLYKWFLKCVLVFLSSDVIQDLTWITSLDKYRMEQKEEFWCIPPFWFHQSTKHFASSAVVYPGAFIFILFYFFIFFANFKCAALFFFVFIFVFLFFLGGGWQRWLPS